MQLTPLSTATGLVPTTVGRVEAVDSADGRSSSESANASVASADSGDDGSASATSATTTTTSKAASGVTPATTGSTTSSASKAASPSDASSTDRSRLNARQPQLQLQIASAQQARDFLEITAAQLQSLKAELSARLSGLRSRGDQLQGQLSKMVSTWQSRPVATAGSVDAQLRFSGTAQATQRFSVRGLDTRSLRAGGSETLTVSFAQASASAGGDASAASLSASIDIDPKLSSEALVKRFDQALSPLGMSVDVDPSGALIFSVAESAWPAVRDSLAVKGNGIRFPAGQPTRARTDAEPAAMQPQEWTTQDATALRDALAQVTQALDKVQQARASVERALADASRQVTAAQASDADAAQAMADAFTTTASQPGYQALSSVSAALAGTSRSRVATLLAQPDA